MLALLALMLPAQAVEVTLAVPVADAWEYVATEESLIGGGFGRLPSLGARWHLPVLPWLDLGAGLWVHGDREDTVAGPTPSLTPVVTLDLHGGGAFHARIEAGPSLLLGAERMRGYEVLGGIGWRWGQGVRVGADLLVDHGLLRSPSGRVADLRLLLAPSLRF